MPKYPLHGRAQRPGLVVRPAFRGHDPPAGRRPRLAGCLEIGIVSPELSAEDRPATCGPAHLDVAHGVAYQETRARVQTVLRAGAQDQPRRRLAATTASLWMMMAVVQRVKRALAQRRLHPPMDVFERFARHQPPPHATLVGHQHQKETPLLQPPQLSRRAWHEAKLLPREHEPVHPRRDVDDTIAVKEDCRPQASGSTVRRVSTSHTR